MRSSTTAAGVMLRETPAAPMPRTRAIKEPTRPTPDLTVVTPALTQAGISAVATLVAVTSAAGSFRACFKTSRPWHHLAHIESSERLGRHGRVVARRFALPLGC